ncbi:MAG: 50S ribosomal protein L6 [Gemmatimonadetes bacterium]|jgi:large subunit ribosomal protein L6|nr:50S ribosomal protein L6 [Gemmatimonadota bacterium]
MSRIGKLPVAIPKGVEVKLADSELTVKGAKGTMTLNVHPEMKVTIDESEIRVERPSDQQSHRALHGLSRSLIQNVVTGVTDGFSKTLEIIGVGYKAEATSAGITLSLGFSHTIAYAAAEGISLTCPNQTTIVVSGVDKQKVGQAAAEIRSFRPPEPYKGKGVRYQGEHVRRKAGKTAGS